MPFFTNKTFQIFFDNMNQSECATLCRDQLPTKDDLRPVSPVSNPLWFRAIPRRRWRYLFTYRFTLVKPIKFSSWRSIIQGRRIVLMIGRNESGLLIHVTWRIWCGISHAALTKKSALSYGPYFNSLRHLKYYHSTGRHFSVHETKVF